MSTRRLLLSAFLILVLLTPGASQSLAQPAVPPAAVTPQASSGSMLFVENAGQWPDAARFQVWGSSLGAGATWLAENAIWLVVDAPHLSPRPSADVLPTPLSGLESGVGPGAWGEDRATALKLTFPGSNPDVRIEPIDPLTTTVSYFLGNDPRQWHPAVPVFGGVRYADIYPGVDLVIGGNSGDWRLEVAPSAKTDQVRMQIEGANASGIEGHTLQLEIDGKPLSVSLPTAPFPYQVVDASRAGAGLALTVHSGQGGSQLTSPDEDPTDLLYGTFLGGESLDFSPAIAVGAMDCAYITGSTHSRNFPSTPGAFDPGNNGDDEVFVVKLTPDGSSLNYATFLGGHRFDRGRSIAVDEAGRATVTGNTFSFDFPTTPGAFDTSHNNPDAELDAFVARLNPTGSSLEYSTFLGGNGQDNGSAVATDSGGNAYVTGYTWSADFPSTAGAFSQTHSGVWDVILVKLNPSGSALVYSTFLGGSELDEGTAIALDGAGNVYVTGHTNSSNFPTTAGAFDTDYICCGTDAFVVKLNATGSALAYSTFLGGSAPDAGGGIDIDEDLSAYVTGGTESADFPTTAGSVGQYFNGGDDGFIVKLNTTGSDLDYGTFLGGSRTDGGDDVVLDATRNAYVVGYTSSLDFPTTPAAFDGSYNGGFDGFVIKLNPTGDTFEYASYLGGNAQDLPRAIAVSDSNRIYIAGETQSHNFPTTPGAFDTSHDIWLDIFVAKMDLTPYVSNVVATIEQPAAGSMAGGLVTVSGFALDRASPVGTGVDKVSICLDGPYGAGTAIGTATYGLLRPDVAAQYGARFAPSGWSLTWNTQSVPLGEHQLVMYARRTTDGKWTAPVFQSVTLRSTHWSWVPLLTRQR